MGQGRNSVEMRYQTVLKPIAAGDISTFFILWLVLSPHEGADPWYILWAFRQGLQCDGVHPPPHPGNYIISVTINMHFGIHAYKLACMSARFASVHVRMFKLSIHAGKNVSIVWIFACKMNDIFTAHPPPPPRGVPFYGTVCPPFPPSWMATLQDLLFKVTLLS